MPEWYPLLKNNKPFLSHRLAEEQFVILQESVEKGRLGREMSREGGKQ